ncbi:MAG: hypothetical protein GX608_03400, partial [Lentisphaerae bacterium]|nr:hypothetical protein [Lentisphaerota bacterium]
MARNRRPADLREGILRRRDEYLENIGEPPAAQYGKVTKKGEAQKLADEIVSGCLPFRFFDVKLMQVGRRGIDWSGKHLAHQEWPAQLNRFFHLAPLAAAWKATRRACYAGAARDYAEDWLRAHPSRPGWTLADGDNTLTLSIRLQMWWSLLPSFFDHPAFDDALLERLAESTACQLGFLKDNLSPEGNWRIAQAESMLVCGLILGHRPEADAWRALGVKVLNDAFHRQVLPDGAHIERNCGYHSWMTRVFERYWKLGRQMPGLGLAMKPDVIARMHDYALANQRPNGSSSGLHDSTGVNAGPRAAGWDRSYLSFRKAAGLPESHPPVRQVFPDAGQAFLRSSWGEKADWLSFDATCWGGGHCHLSRNAVQLFAGGRALVVDPGILNYDARDPMMYYGRSTRSHSTVNLNGWNQAMTDPGRLQYSCAPGYECVASAYGGGYWPGRYQWYFDQGCGSGIWAEHFRLLLWICGRAIVVIDAVTRNAEPAAPFLECNWQLAPGMVELDAPSGRA